jgi:hypothetical protein
LTSGDFYAPEQILNFKYKAEYRFEKKNESSRKADEDTAIKEGEQGRYELSGIERFLIVLTTTPR